MLDFCWHILLSFKVTDSQVSWFLKANLRLVLKQWVLKRQNPVWHIAIGSMYGIFTYIYHTNQPNVGEYAIHGFLGIAKPCPNKSAFFKTCRPNQANHVVHALTNLKDGTLEDRIKFGELGSWVLGGNPHATFAYLSHEKRAPGCFFVCSGLYYFPFMWRL